MFQRVVVIFRQCSEYIRVINNLFSFFLGDSKRDCLKSKFKLLVFCLENEIYYIIFEWIVKF